jgi:copper resistance protein B
MKVMDRPSIVLAAVLLFAGARGLHAQGHVGHGGQDHQQSRSAAAEQEDHSAHRKTAGQQEYPAHIAPVTDEDRAAAFPKLDERGHAVHDTAVHYYVLFDQLELEVGDGVTAGNWDNHGWIGGDVNRFWFRTEGDVEDGDFEEAQAHALFGRAIHRWWDVVAGVRQDVRPGPARTWAAVGIQGLAPYWFEVEATAYIGESGRTHFRLETEYDLLLTNRMVLQPLVELEIAGKSDPERHIGAGLSSAEVGLRLRYELRRELAPYVGVIWKRRFFGTADFARAAGEDTSTARLAAGVRVWF